MSSILQPSTAKPGGLLTPAPATPAVTPTPLPPSPSPTMRSFGDADATRAAIYDNALKAAQAIQPAQNTRYALELHDVGWADPDKVSLAVQKKAILEGKSLQRRLKGTWVLKDAQGQPVDAKTTTVAHVPHLTQRGTFILGGTEYTLAHQMRLRSGIYHREKENGELEAHVNVLPGKGLSHHYRMEPDTGIFKLDIAQSSLPLFPVLKALGASDKELRDAWGSELHAANQAKDDPRVLDKLYARLVRKPDLQANAETRRQALVHELTRMELDPEVTQRTLGHPHKNLSKEVILASTRKLLALTRKEAEPDDRDHLAFQHFMGPEDLIAERLGRDRSVINQMLWKSTYKGHLQHMPAGALTKNVHAAIMKSGLGMPLEEINPSDVFDQQMRVSRLGYGGIQSLDAVPDESRNVQPSHLGYVDLVKTPECYDAGTEVLTRCGWRRWPNVDAQDELACLVNDRLEFHRPLALIQQDYDGPMYGARSQTIEYLVTPEHRLYVRPMHPSAAWRIETAEEVGCKSRRHRTGGHLPWQPAESFSHFELPAVIRKSNNTNTVPPLLLRDWAEFIGWFLSEGHYTLLPEKGYYVTGISQSRTVHPDNCARIENLLQRLPFAWSYNRSMRAYILSGKQLTTYCAQFGFCQEKWIPPELLAADVDSRRALYEALLLGDGRRDKKGELYQFCTTSKQLAEDFQLLAFSLGIPSRITVEVDRRKATYLPVHVVNLHRETEREVHERNRFQVHYRGQIYCAEVPGGLLYVRRGSTSGHWSGNSFKVGVDSRMSYIARKGADGKVYTPFHNPKTGQTVFKSPQDVADLTVAFPNEMRSNQPMVAAMVGGKTRMVPRDKVDLVLPHMEHAFSPTTNLVPLKSTIKAQRVAMGSRFITQALPLGGAESPLVRSMVPGQQGLSFEEHYGRYMGTAHAKDVAGRVAKVTPEAITVKYADGTQEDHELYSHFPYNRKTYLHSTPLVKEGDPVQPGQILAHSNYTDKTGAMALGMNARVAYMPYKGLNYEDAYVVSEGMAKRLSSEHMYQHAHEWDEKTRKGTLAYASLFPGTYDKKTLATLDDKGVVKPGTVVQPGHPLILAATARELSHKQVHSGHKGSWADRSVTWDHHSEGMVTDVAHTAKGVTVAVKALSPSQVGDKISGRYGDKGVISAVIPDSEMPHDARGRPYEVLANPLGVISRCYDEQTEFLTTRGWMFGRDITLEDELLCFDVADRTVRAGRQLQPMTVQDYRGEMYRFVASHMDFCLSPGHSMWARCDYPGAEWQKTTVDRIAFHRWWVPTVGQVVSGADAPFVLPHLVYHVKDHTSDKRDLVLDPGDWAEFLGWYVSEGHCVFQEGKTFISQDEEANPAKCEQIADLLDRLPFTWSYKESTQQFVVYSKRLAAYCERFGNCYHKCIDPWVFQQSQATRQRFLDACWAGDGHDGVSHTGLFKTLGSTSERLVDDLQRLWLYQGVAAVKRPVSVRPGNSPMWRCAVMLKKTDRMLEPKGWSREAYDGKIYCPTVSTGFVITRRNGKVLIAGNTNPGQVVEAALGKIAEKTGKPYVVEDFNHEIDDVSGWARKQLEQHGLSDMEEITDPTTGRKIKVLTGNRFYMKLHHTSESKGQGRGLGAYTAEETPARGGAEGCFAPKQVILTSEGPLDIAHICDKHLGVQVKTYSKALGEWVYRPVVDWFVRRAKVTDLLTVKTTDGRALFVTPNHLVYQPDGSMVSVDQLSAGDHLVTWGPVPTNHQWDFLYGTMLGDASVSDSAFTCEHSVKQVEYVNWKQSILAGLEAITYDRQGRKQANVIRGKEVKSDRSRIVSVSYRHIYEPLRAVCYTGPEATKRVTRTWLDRVSGLGIAVWVLDDGSITNQGKKSGQVHLTGNIATHAFTEAECRLLIDWLTERYAAPCSINTAGALCLSAALCRALVEEVARWVPWQVIPGSKRFLKAQVQRLQEIAAPVPLATQCCLGLVPLRIKEVLPYRHDKPNVEEINVYDFTVADTHCYCASHALVSNSKRLALMDVNALLSHGATEVLRDGKLVRGQKNQEYWTNFMGGFKPPSPKVPFVYHKFINQLKAAGVNVVRNGSQQHIMALTDKDVDHLAENREIQNTETVDWKTGLKPIPGGLFDVGLTGGHQGNRWAHIKLHEPMPNPAFEEPIRRLLGLTGRQLEAVLAGQDKLKGQTGPRAIQDALGAINVDKAIEQARADVASGRKTLRDNAVRKLGYLKACQKLGVHPKEWMLSKVPVIPPAFRPVSVMQNTGGQLVNDANYLYKELFDANQVLKDTSGQLADTGAERLNVYHAFRAVTGLGDPIQPKSKEKQIKGMLRQIFGSSSKFGTVQQKLLGSNVELVGRAVVTPNPDLHMDEVGLPENRAWEVYTPFIVRRLVRRGVGRLQALQYVKDRHNLARQAMLDEMSERPVLVNRAPVLHRYGMLAFKPRLTKGDVLQVSPIVVGGFGMDFDGDASNYQVPAEDAAKAEALEKMLPSKNLIAVSTLKTPMYQPRQEYVSGLWAATSIKNKLKRPRVFATTQDAVRAYHRGELDPGDPIEILNR